MTIDHGNWCTYQLFPQTNNPPQPAEFCENKAEPGEEFCWEHLQLEDGPDPDVARDRMIDDQLGVW